MKIVSIWPDCSIGTICVTTLRASVSEEKLYTARTLSPRSAPAWRKAPSWMRPKSVVGKMPAKAFLPSFLA